MRVLLTLILLSGCSIVNKPSRPIDLDASADVSGDVFGDVDRADVLDAGIDADAATEICTDGEDNDGDGDVDCADTDCVDGTMCHPDEASCVCGNGRGRELNCEDGIDNDYDGTTDCADFDCVAAGGAECCGEDTRPTHWPDPGFDGCASEWTGGIGTLACDTADDEIDGFVSIEPFGIVWPNCLSLGFGATLEFGVVPLDDVNDAVCDASGVCDEYVRMVLAPRDIPMEGGGVFFQELAITVHASGRVEVSQSTGEDTVMLGTGNVDPGNIRTIRLTIRPSTADDGTAEMHATVVLPGTSAMPGAVTIFDGFFVDLDAMSLENNCGEVPGLYLVAEGIGDSVRITEIDASQSECANPNLFEPGPDVLTTYFYDELGTTSLELDPARLISEAPRAEPSWATGGMLAPSILLTDADADWNLAAAATNRQPRTESVSRLGYAIAHRRNSTWNSIGGWTLGSSVPVLGVQPPACPMGTCEDDPFPSFRDPFLFLLGETIWVAWAQEIEPREHFEIRVAALDSLPSDGVTVLSPTDAVTECESLRDPVITSRPGVTGSMWLFYSCYDNGPDNPLAPVTSSGVHALPLAIEGMVSVPPGTVETTVLSATDVGTPDLHGGELIVEVDGDDDPVFGLWYLADNQVGLALGSPKSPHSGTLADIPDVPIFAQFPGNPVLRPADRALRGCTDCPILGLAVTRIPESATLRFLVARETPVGPVARYEFIPLDQTWLNLAAQ